LSSLKQARNDPTDPDEGEVTEFLKSERREAWSTTGFAEQQGQLPYAKYEHASSYEAAASAQLRHAANTDCLQSR
jgi:hypothetical protein